MKKDSERLLVVASEPKNFSDTGGIEEFYAAIWISGAPDNIEIGHKVDVWIDGPIMESYPAQATAQKMAVKVSPKLEEANLYEHEAIQKALQGQEFHEQAIVTVIAVEYDAELKNWTVQFKRTDSLDKVTIEVDDE